MAKFTCRTWVIVQMGNKQSVTFSRLLVDDNNELIQSASRRIYLTQKMRMRINDFMKNYQCDHSGVTISGEGMGVSMRWSDLKHYKGVLMSTQNYWRALFDTPYLKIFTGE